MSRLVCDRTLLLAVLLTAACGREIVQTGGGGGQPVSVIRGSLSFPSDFLPVQRIVAFDAETMAPAASVQTGYGQSSYTLPVGPGSYYVVAYSLDALTEGMPAGYSQAVPSGLVYGLEDHSLIRIEVAPGQTVTGIDPIDWYAPSGSFPEMP